jgi:hypothetical protein
MDLKQSRFYYAGEALNFAVFSDHACRVKYVESIRLPIGRAQVEVYTIEPNADSQWIAVQQRTDGKSSLRFFVREKGTFRERHDLPEHMTEHILPRVLQSSRNSERPLGSVKERGAIAPRTLRKSAAEAR